MEPLNANGAFSYIMTKKLIQRAEADIGLIFTAYNLRRLMNILGKEKIKIYMSTIIFLLISILRELWLKIRRCTRLYFLNNFPYQNQNIFLKPLKIHYIQAKFNESRGF